VGRRTRRRLWSGLGRVIEREAGAAPPLVDLGATDNEVLSPCTGVCVLLPAGWCSGCGRTMEQIASWTSLGSDARRLVCAEARVRMER